MTKTLSDYDLTVKYNGYRIRMARWPKHVNEYAAVYRKGQASPVYKTRDRLADGEVLAKLFRLIDAGEV